MKLVRRQRAIHFDIAGPPGAPVVLFVHSLGTDLGVWEAQARSLSARFRCLRYDLPGHGTSEAGPEESGFDELCADALALLDEVHAPTAHVCGLSLGGMVGQRLATLAPGASDRLVLCATALRVGTEAAWSYRIAAVRRAGLEALADDILARWFTAGLRERRPDTWAVYRETLSRTSVDGYVAGCRALASTNLTDQAPAIRAPTLVIVGDRDVATPPQAAAALRGAIARARLVVLSGAAHILNAERPSEMTALLASHLDGQHRKEENA